MPMRSLTFLLRNLSAFDIKILVEDKGLLSCNRPIMQHQLLFSGEDIRLEKSEKYIGRSYSIAFTKTEFVEKDKTKNCKIYPNDKFESYKECDDEFIKEAYKEFNGTLPAWMNLSQTRGESTINIINYNTSLFLNIFNGVTLSNCHQPCTTSSIVSRLVRQWEMEHEKTSSMIDIVPSPTVVVKRTDFVSPPASSLLSEFGGAMGLWLGLGMAQLVQITLIIMKNAVYFVKNNKLMKK